MKTENIFIGSITAKAKAIHLIDQIEIGASIRVTISDTKGKSARCRGLQWMWATEVADSGIGSWDAKEDVHTAAKWRWAVPILERDDEVFAFIWGGICSEIGKDPVKMKYAVENFVSTEGEGFAIGEYLTCFERYWRAHGVNLTIPDDGLMDWVEAGRAA